MAHSDSTPEAPSQRKATHQAWALFAPIAALVLCMVMILALGFKEISDDHNRVKDNRVLIQRDNMRTQCINDTLAFTARLGAADRQAEKAKVAQQKIALHDIVGGDARKGLAEFDKSLTDYLATIKANDQQRAQHPLGKC